MSSGHGYYHQHTINDNEEDYWKKKYFRRERARKAFFWLWLWTLVLLPFTFIAYVQYDQYAHSLEHQGCKVINVFEGGAKVYECPRGIK